MKPYSYLGRCFVLLIVFSSAVYAQELTPATPRYGAYYEPTPEAPLVSPDTGLPLHWSTIGPSPFFGNPYLYGPYGGYGWGLYRPAWGAYGAAWGYRFPRGPLYYGSPYYGVPVYGATVYGPFISTYPPSSPNFIHPGFTSGIVVPGAPPATPSPTHLPAPQIPQQQPVPAPPMPEPPFQNGP